MPDFEIMQGGNYGGDAEEQRAWPELKSIFPHYETLWRHLIVPLTERPYGISLRSDLLTVWMKFAEDHYSIFLHLVAAVDRAKQCREQLLAFEAVFSHLGTMFDLVEDLIFTADEVIQGKAAAVPMELGSPEAFAQYASQWAISNDGQGYAKQVRKQGRAFPVNFFDGHHKETFLR